MLKEKIDNRKFNRNPAKVTNNQKNTGFMLILKNRIQKVGGVCGVFKECKIIKSPNTINNYLKGVAVLERTENDIIQAIEKLEKSKK